MAKKPPIFRFESESAMCAAFIKDADRQGYDAYPETCGYDIVLVHRENRWQVAIEAKQQFNAHVVCQAADRVMSRYHHDGPDFIAVLTPEGGDPYVADLARRLGIVMIRARGVPDKRGMVKSGEFAWSKAFTPDLPDDYLSADRSISWAEREWPQHVFAEPLKLPDYVPDVAAGKAAPVALTEWKIRAIRICILLERRGYVTAADFKTLEISPSRWVQGGWVRRDGKRLIAGALPDFKKQHPKNFDEIAGDFAVWGKKLPETGDLFAAKT